MGNEDPLVGQQLASFRILRVLGRGGMATVYYGWDVKLERPVAVKVIDARYQGDPAYAQRFVNEAKSIAAWHHPNIIQVYYADDVDGLYYFAMEYVPGLDLGGLLDLLNLQGTLADLTGALTDVLNQVFDEVLGTATATTGGHAAGVCDILHLAVGPIHLDLLGNLLCSLSDLLNNRGNNARAELVLVRNILRVLDQLGL